MQTKSRDGKLAVSEKNDSKRSSTNLVLEEDDFCFEAMEGATLYEIANTIYAQCVLCSEIDRYLNCHVKVREKEYVFKVHENDCFVVVLEKVAQQFKV